MGAHVSGEDEALIAALFILSHPGFSVASWPQPLQFGSVPHPLIVKDKMEDSKNNFTEIIRYFRCIWFVINLKSFVLRLCFNYFGYAPFLITIVSLDEFEILLKNLLTSSYAVGGNLAIFISKISLTFIDLPADSYVLLNIPNSVS